MQAPRKPIALFVGALLPLVAFISSLSAAAGDLDITFDGDGKVITALNLSRNDWASSVAVHTDGKIAVSGYFTNGLNIDIGVTRYNSDGSLDTTFDSDGIAVISTSAEESSTDILVQPNGKIVVCGYVYVGSQGQFAVFRYNTNGSLDTTFDSDGKVTTPIGSSNSIGSSVVLQSDGKIVVAGHSYDATTGGDFAVVRYNTDGSLDTTFDSDGKLTTAIGAGNSQDTVYGAVLQPDGKIIVVGYSHNGANNDFAVARYNTDGSLDTTFDSDGKLTTAIGAGGDEAVDIAVQPDGKIVVVGYSYNGSNYDFAVVRYNTDGSLDTTFDSDGKLTTAIGAGTEAATGVVLQPDGKLIAVGYSHNGSNNDFAVVRYNANGSLDSTFHSDGKLTTAVRSGDDNAVKAVLQPDGKLIAVGSSHNGSNSDVALVRYDLGTTSATTTTSTTTTTTPSTTSSSSSSTTSSSSSTTSSSSSVPTSTSTPTATTSTSISVTPVAPTTTVSPAGEPVQSTVTTIAIATDTGSTPSTSSSVVTTTTTISPNVNSGTEITPEQFEDLTSNLDAETGAGLLVNGRTVDMRVSTTRTTFSMSALGAMVTVRCYDSTGSDIPMSADSRFELTSDDSIELIVSGFKPGSDIIATIHSNPVLLGTITADASGAGVQRWKVPDSLKAGLHTLVASGDLAQVDDAIFGLRIMVDDAPFINRIVNNWIIRILLGLAVFTALLIPARLRRREEEEEEEEERTLHEPEVNT